MRRLVPTPQPNVMDLIQGPGRATKKVKSWNREKMRMSRPAPGPRTPRSPRTVTPGSASTIKTFRTCQPNVPTAGQTVFTPGARPDIVGPNGIVSAQPNLFGPQQAMDTFVATPGSAFLAGKQKIATRTPWPEKR